MLSLCVFLLLSACRSACEDVADAQERDYCWYNQIQTLSTSDAPQVLALTQKIQDTVIRDAAILSWIQKNSKGLAATEGHALCQQLAQTERMMCERRLMSVHLNR